MRNLHINNRHLPQAKLKTALDTARKMWYNIRHKQRIRLHTRTYDVKMPSAALKEQIANFKKQTTTKLVFNTNPSPLGFNKPLFSSNEIKNDFGSLTTEEKVKRIEQREYIPTARKAQIIKNIILDAFLKLEAPEELTNYVCNLKVRKPELAVKLLTDILKIEQQEKLVRIKERQLNEKPKHAPIIIVNQNNLTNQSDESPVQYIEPENKIKPEFILQPSILNIEQEAKSEAENEILNRNVK